MSERRRTNRSRNEQRHARELAAIRGISYMQALAEIRAGAPILDPTEDLTEQCETGETFEEKVMDKLAVLSRGLEGLEQTLEAVNRALELKAGIAARPQPQTHIKGRRPSDAPVEVRRNSGAMKQWSRQGQGLGDAVRKRRLELGMSQEDMARGCGMSVTDIRLLERGMCGDLLSNLSPELAAAFKEGEEEGATQRKRGAGSA